MSARWFYRCSECGAEFPIDAGRYVCDHCAAFQEPERPLRGVLEVEWEGEVEAGMLLRCGDASVPVPVETRHFPPVPVGGTPLWKPDRLIAELARTPGPAAKVRLKDDTCEPSGSFKDRASYLVAAFARERGISEIALASTGNAASSMACVGAAAGLSIKVFLPKKAPVAKRVQVLQYGASLVEVDGTYDVAFERSLEYTNETGTLSRNTAYNPLTIEGKKTVSFEIEAALAAEGLRADHVFVPTGDGVIIAGVYRGYENLVKLGKLERVPTIWACQAAGSSAIARAAREGGFGKPVASDTMADSISVDSPRNGIHAMAKLARYGGRCAVVSDGEIMEAQRELSRHSGLFAEPSSAAAWAGFRKVRGSLHDDATCVVMITGSGLKDIRGAMRSLGIE
jgi:threonine synthase